MESILSRLRRALREAGPSNWPAIAAQINEANPDACVSHHLMRKIAYRDRDNPRIGTIQPLLDHFKIGEDCTDEACQREAA